MFACWCSEMIYYTCNMKRARWLNVVSICKKRRRYCGAVTWKICFFTSAWIEFCSKISLWLCRCFSRIGIFFFAIDIMLHGSFENINKATEIARKVEDEHSLKLARTVEHHDMNISNTRHDGIDVCLLRMNLMFEESFLHFNEFSRNLFIWHVFSVTSYLRIKADVC